MHRNSEELGFGAKSSVYYITCHDCIVHAAGTKASLEDIEPSPSKAKKFAGDVKPSPRRSIKADSPTKSSMKIVIKTPTKVRGEMSTSRSGGSARKSKIVLMDEIIDLTEDD